MSAATEAWERYSENQKREIRTAVVLTALGPAIRENLTSIVNIFKRVFEGEMMKLRAKGHLNADEEKLLALLKDASSVSASLSGLRHFERLTERAENFSMHTLLSILRKCWNEAPQVLKFPGFGVLLQKRALSKMVEFAAHWRYSGRNNYDPPSGMSEPFSGYDEVINALMGHPLCKAKMAEEAAKWEAEYKKRMKKAA